MTCSQVQVSASSGLSLLHSPGQTTRSWCWPDLTQTPMFPPWQGLFAPRVTHDDFTVYIFVFSVSVSSP